MSYDPAVELLRRPLRRRGHLSSRRGVPPRFRRDQQAEIDRARSGRDFMTPSNYDESIERRHG